MNATRPRYAFPIPSIVLVYLISCQVRCSGEKTGCQRCSNLHLKCAFSISRIGKVPGKRSKANRVAATSAPISSSSSSMSTPMMSPPLLTTARTFENTNAGTYGRHDIPVSTACYPFTQEYSTGVLPLASEATYYPHSPPLPPPGYPAPADQDLSNLNGLCWTAELDQLGDPGLLSPDWEIDAHDESISTSTYRASLPEEKKNNTPNAYPSPVISSSEQYTRYLNLLHSIDHTIQFTQACKSPSAISETMPVSMSVSMPMPMPVSMSMSMSTTPTLDSILVASQRYLTTLLQITDSPGFTHTYNEGHLLFSVALDKMIFLFSLGYAEFRRRMEIYDTMGTGMGWSRYGAFEMDVVEQMALCRRVFVEEVKRARVCLGRLVGAMGYISMSASGSGSVSVSSSPGRHERLCEEMRRRLDGLLDDLERNQSIQGVHLVG